ncbi:hypothetical protein DAPPUDRAFT_106161 [Daphnia pulex]|uniref:DUF5641 domain-containing protein n=1 Tax=Daphnia pulex TaxID=6669 RepID=E9GT83_DAPPU|nr:hypothetical protein DAPPUDRAFT_106161 [Daphnia pulex]|eukprot:EFX77233.1 hypothetical protein DAPPUDRAFT_106161 [Daphnia pulex]
MASIVVCYQDVYTATFRTHRFRSLVRTQRLKCETGSQLLGPFRTAVSHFRRFAFRFRSLGTPLSFNIKKLSKLGGKFIFSEFHLLFSDNFSLLDENAEPKSQYSELNSRFHELEIEYGSLENERERNVCGFRIQRNSEAARKGEEHRVSTHIAAKMNQAISIWSPRTMEMCSMLNTSLDGGKFYRDFSRVVQRTKTTSGGPTARRVDCKLAGSRGGLVPGWGRSTVGRTRRPRRRASAVLLEGTAMRVLLPVSPSDVSESRHLECSRRESRLFMVFAAGPLGMGSLWVSRVIAFLLSPLSLISSKSPWIKSARASPSTLQCSGHPRTADLNRFHQNQAPSKSVKLGQVVLVHQDYVKRINWNVGRVIELIKGRDHLVRKVKLVMVDKKGNTSIVNGPLQNLYPLEVKPGIIDADFAKKRSRIGDYVTSSGQICKRTYMGGVWKTTALGDEATDCRPHVAQPRETTIASDFDGGAMNHPSDVAMATGARPRHGPPKMSVVNVLASADLERSNPIEWIDDEDLTPKQLRAEVKRRDRAQVAWRPKPATKNPNQREVLDG